MEQEATRESKMKRTTIVIALGVLCAAPAAAVPPMVSLKAQPTAVTYGGSTTLSGTISIGRAGLSVDILARDCGQTAFKKAATATTTASGNFSTAIKPSATTVYEAKLRSATSPPATVTVAPLVTLKKIARGRFTVTVKAAQSFVGKTVVFQRLRNGSWVRVKTVALTSVATTTAPTQVSRARFRTKLAARLRVRALLPHAQAGSCYAQATSKTIRS
jgi:hypothetical protein